MIRNLANNSDEMAARKYYVVWKGLKEGIFETWKECEAQVKGVEGAIYKSFTDRQEAEVAYSTGWKKYFLKKRVSNPRVGNPVHVSLSVDAACSGNPGVLEYQGVDTGTGKVLFHQGPFPLGTINIGEFLAIVHALAYLKKYGSDIPVYSDSRTAIKWVKDRAIKTKLPRSPETEELFGLTDRAITWLKNNPYPNQVLKWETESWGEIPADFGRK